MNAVISKILVFAAANERHLGGIAFVFGFGVDLFTFTVLSVAYANLAFAGYLFLALSMVLLGGVFPRLRVYGNGWARAASVLAPLAAQYAIGSLLSGFMIFYAKSAELSAAWPFLLLLAGVFIGNEFFRTHYKYLAFQLSLLFFALYAYLIFAIPLLFERLGPAIFLTSTAASVVGFAAYLYVLGRINKVELYASLRFALPGALATLLLINVAYFTGALPPIPLTMPESGIYHSLEKVDGKYVVNSEKTKKWYEFYLPRMVHTQGGTTLYAYTAVAAPIKFGARVTHKWERYDEGKSSWVTESRIEFAISGGRPGGYRGYSEFTPHMAGKWRVSVETPSGQVIGRVPFTLVVTDVAPVLHEETH